MPQDLKRKRTIYIGEDLWRRLSHTAVDVAKGNKSELIALLIEFGLPRLVAAKEEMERRAAAEAEEKRIEAEAFQSPDEPEDEGEGEGGRRPGPK